MILNKIPRPRIRDPTPKYDGFLECENTPLVVISVVGIPGLESWLAFCRALFVATINPIPIPIAELPTTILNHVATGNDTSRSNKYSTSEPKLNAVKAMKSDVFQMELWAASPDMLFS
jgi:hypothetical protein